MTVSNGQAQLNLWIAQASGVRVVFDLVNKTVQLRYAFADPLGSQGGETDDRGMKKSHEAYYPYGGSAGSDEEAKEVNDRTQRYAGQERDASGLYGYGYRYYEPAGGRWLAADPGGLIDGLNLFRFCRNNPLKFDDANGKESIDKVAHFIWVGANPLPDYASYNIIDFKRKNSNFTVNLWTDDRKAMESNISNSGLSLKGFNEKINIKNISQLYENNIGYHPEDFTMKRGAVLASGVAREMNGVYKNYPAAADLFRYAILAEHGGIYMDVDVHTRESLPKDIDAEEGMLNHIGNRWGELTNTVIASESNGANITYILNSVLSAYDKPGNPPSFLPSVDRDKSGVLKHVEGIGGDQENLTSVMYGAKRSDPATRMKLTMGITGPDMLADFINNENQQSGLGWEVFAFADPKLFGQRGSYNKASGGYHHNPRLMVAANWSRFSAEYKRGRRNSL